ncbi:hypothetical protein [Dactylosporangium sp. CA-092794]|uniref:hypothetical protein n=1 Tax=Dactylosporangium sp. CA-092794 TaxID=3239929 RepID=UPI003D8EAF86
MVPPIKAGDLLSLREPDYRYGAGELTLRVTVPPVESPDPEWMTLTGVEILWNGDRGRERQVAVRTSALHDPRMRTTS